MGKYRSQFQGAVQVLREESHTAQKKKKTALENADTQRRIIIHKQNNVHINWLERNEIRIIKAIINMNTIRKKRDKDN